jgi:hypothetical protein
MAKYVSITHLFPIATSHAEEEMKQRLMSLKGFEALLVCAQPYQLSSGPLSLSGSRAAQAFCDLRKSIGLLLRAPCSLVSFDCVDLSALSGLPQLTHSVPPKLWRDRLVKLMRIFRPVFVRISPNAVLSQTDTDIYRLTEKILGTHPVMQALQVMILVRGIADDLRDIGQVSRLLQLEIRRIEAIYADNAVANLFVPFLLPPGCPCFASHVPRRQQPPEPHARDILQSTAY